MSVSLPFCPGPECGARGVSRPVEELADFLSLMRTRRYSFLKSHGSNHDRFIRKQGLDK